FTKGSSGPTMTMFIFSERTHCLMAPKSFAPIGILVAMAAVPAFPGATKRRSSFGLCFNFQANVCSRPPAPRIRIFIFLKFPQKYGLKWKLYLLRRGNIWARLLPPFRLASAIITASLLPAGMSPSVPPLFQGAGHLPQGEGFYSVSLI